MKASLVSSKSSVDNNKTHSNLPRSVVLLFAIASGVSVANVYYAQPLLDILASDFNISHAAIGGVVTATQIGCALALVFLVPLGDLINRRRLMAIQLMALISALLMVAFAHSTIVLLTGMLAVGLLGTAMTQGLIAYAAVLRPHMSKGMWSVLHRVVCSLGYCLPVYFQGELVMWRVGAACTFAQLSLCS